MTEIRTSTHQINGEAVRVIEVWQDHQDADPTNKVLVLSIPIEQDELITVIL